MCNIKLFRNLKWGDDDSKPFCTLQVFIRATASTKGCSYFRGQGKVLKAEIQLYDERVDVYFQLKMWADKSFGIAWANKTSREEI